MSVSGLGIAGAEDLRARGLLVEFATCNKKGTIYRRSSHVTQLKADEGISFQQGAFPNHYPVPPTVIIQNERHNPECP